jgi:hypothetical protein
MVLLNSIMKIVAILIAIMLSVIKLIAIMLSVIMLNVIMLIVVMLSVMVPIFLLILKQYGSLFCLHMHHVKIQLKNRTKPQNRTSLNVRVNCP